MRTNRVQGHVALETARLRWASLPLFVVLVAVGCSDDNDPPTGPTTGSIVVTVPTTGEDAPASCTVVLDGNTSRAVDANGSVILSSVSAGSQTVELSGLDGHLNDLTP